MQSFEDCWLQLQETSMYEFIKVLSLSKPSKRPYYKCMSFPSKLKQNKLAYFRLNTDSLSDASGVSIYSS